MGWGGYILPARHGGKTSVQKASELLGVAISATDAEVNDAFRRKVKNTHPDTAEDGAAADYTIDELKAARDAMRDHAAITSRTTIYHEEKRPCPMCHGRGTVLRVGSFGTDPCVTCHGTGEV